MPLTSGGPSNFDTLLTTTTQYRQRELVDNIHNATPTLMFFEMRNIKRFQNGGESILLPLLYARHDGVQKYTGYQTIDIDPQEGITAAQYIWRSMVVPVTISREERRKNSGESALISMIEAKMEQAELSAIATLNEDILGTNADNALEILGLRNFLQKAAVGSQTGSTEGGIDRATHTWWNNQYGNVASAFSTNGLNIMRTTYNSCSQGRDHPDLIVTTQSGYENYERVLEARERYQTSTTTEAGERVAEAGFEFLKFKGAFIFYDEAILANTMYMLNTRYWRLIVDSESDWAIQPFITPSNQLATTALIPWMGALCCNNLSRNGVVDNVDTF